RASRHAQLPSGSKAAQALRLADDDRAHQGGWQCGESRDRPLVRTSSPRYRRQTRRGTCRTVPALSGSGAQGLGHTQHFAHLDVHAQRSRAHRVPMTDRYAVIGNPIAHSKSPQIHLAFARQTGQDIEYTSLLAPADGFRVTVESFRAAGGRGVNVTLPFKLEAFDLADDVSARAKEAQAANFLDFDGGRIRADNTDGSGLTRDITGNLGFSIAGRRALLLGAGGAARGVLHPLLAQQPAILTIANRTVEKALRLAETFRYHPSAGSSVLSGLR